MPRDLVAGAGVCFLTGFFGVGGGFLIVPTLAIALAFTMRTAVGTSLAIITGTSLLGLAVHLLAGRGIDLGTTVYLLDCRRRTLGPRVGGVLNHLPRSGLVAQWQHRRLGVRAELSWPEEHVFLTANARPGPQTDLAIGLLMGSELERYR